LVKFLNITFLLIKKVFKIENKVVVKSAYISIFLTKLDIYTRENYEGTINTSRIEELKYDSPKALLSFFIQQ